MKKKAGIDLGLTDKEKAFLHKIARSAIVNRLKGRESLKFTTDLDNLKKKMGAFVSLHRKGNLRGCIGFIQPVKPLYEIVPEMAVSAAFQDPRFEPLREEELENLDIELSVLTPMKLLRDINEIEIGKHGLMIVKDHFSGLLLPQVASEYGWDRKTFLRQTCLKAGLPPDSWEQDDTDVYLFSADVF